MTATPIGESALLSDRHSAALVSRDGSIDWLCLPRFDSPSVFGALLDDTAGQWSIRPTGEYAVSRRYVEGTMVLQTTFDTPTGNVVVTDALATGSSDDAHRLAPSAPSVLIRSVHCERGTVALDLRFRPRPEYGRITPLLSVVPGGVLARGGAERLTLSTPVPPRAYSDQAVVALSMQGGETVHFALHRSSLSESPPRIWDQSEISAELAATITAWAGWSELHQSYQGPWRDLVLQSGRVLHALTFQPTGAIVAAPTTSLPEWAGGQRNWDYRYAWIRDASLTMEALWVAACPREAAEFFDFMATAAAFFDPNDILQVMFGVGGEHYLHERQLPHLQGWRNSRPVRVGNAAHTQVQLDGYGVLLGAVHRYRNMLTGIDPHVGRLLVSLADAAARRWREPDQGIWEIRGEPRHFVHTKVMCWVALDWAIALADQLGATDHVHEWTRARREIRAEILSRGWSNRANAFTQAFGSEALDASSLMMPIVGFLPATDRRMRATVDAIADHLTGQRGLVYRYDTADGIDGLTGREGMFLACTFWLAHAQALCGLLDQAHATFDRAIGYANDVGPARRGG
jgi:alpha,alpha-trehalase